MDKKQAWEGLFSPNPPVGTDLDSAANALDGVQETHGVNLAAPVLKRAREFLMEPDAFIAANPGDARVPLWTRLAASLGVTIAPTAPSSSTVPPAATSPPPPAATPAPTKALSPSALRKAMAAAAAGPSLAGVVVVPGTPSGDPSTKRVSPDDGAKPSAKPKDPRKPKKDADVESSTTLEPSAKDKLSRGAGRPTETTGEGRGRERSSQTFQRHEGVVRGIVDVVRELAVTAATRGTETGRQRDARARAELRRRQELLDADAAERARLQEEDEQALRNRLTIENAAGLRHKLLELRVADEQRRRDAAAADEQRRRDEEAEERKIRRKEAADARKRQAELVELERERTETEAARPRPSRVAERVPASLLATLQSAPYLAQRDRALELARRAANADAAARSELDALALQLRRDVRSMAPGYQVAASAELLLSLIEQVEAGRNQSDPGWFTANFITGST